MEDKFTSFEPDGKLGGDFRVACDFHIRIDALSEAIKFYDMYDTFNVLSRNTVLELEEKLDVMLVTQAAVNLASEALTSDP